MITTYGIPSFASHAIDQDIIPATVPSLAVMESGLGEIPYMRDVNLAGSRVVLYQVGTDSLGQTDELFAFKSITPFIPDHLFLENIRKIMLPFNLEIWLNLFCYSSMRFPEG
jgi:hypothetical protein